MRRKRPRLGGGKQFGIAVRGGRICRRAAVCVTQHDCLDQSPQVVAVLDQVVGKTFQQLGMTGRVFGMHLVERMHETSPQQTCPSSVDDVFRQKTLVAFGNRQLNEFGAGSEFGLGR